MPEEAKKLLHAWAKLHKEDNDLTNGDMSLMPALQVDHRARLHPRR